MIKGNERNRWQEISKEASRMKKVLSREIKMFDATTGLTIIDSESYWLDMKLVHLMISPRESLPVLMPGRYYLDLGPIREIEVSCEEEADCGRT